MQAINVMPKDLVEAKLFVNEDQVLQEAVRYLFQNRPEMRISYAVYCYQADDELSLAKAAAMAGVSIERMKDILAARCVRLRLGPANIEEAIAELETLETWFDTDTN